MNKDRGWIQTSKTIVRGTSYDVSGLDAGATYQFRVTAETEAGIGVASEPSAEILIKPKEG